MTVFACRSCGAVVTAEVAETTLPDDSPALADNECREVAPRIQAGRFAVDPEPFGPPYVPAADDPRVVVPGGPRGTVLVNPGDVRGLTQHPDRSRLNGCCRLDGLDGPNLVCGGCGAEIATEQSDCWVSWHDVRLEPAAVLRSDHAC